MHRFRLAACVKIFETTFLKSPEIHGGPLSLLLNVVLKEQSMIQPDLRNLLIMLSHSATDAKSPLEYEAKHGPPPNPVIRPVGQAEEHPQGFGA